MILKEPEEEEDLAGGEGELGKEKEGGKEGTFCDGEKRKTSKGERIQRQQKKPCVREKRAQKPPFCRDSDIATAFQLLSLPAYGRKKECEKCKKAEAARRKRSLFVLKIARVG